MTSERPPASTEEEVKALARAVAAAPDPARRLNELDPFEQLRHQSQLLEVRLRKKYADWLLYGLGAQLVVADAVFVLYASIGTHWHLSAQTIDVWLAATFVQVVGIVLVVTRYLFPPQRL